MYPLQGGHQIRISRVAVIPVLFTERRQIQITQDIQTVVDGNDHHIALHTHIKTVISDLLDGRAGGIRAAVDPHKNRMLRFPVQCFRPDVQVLAVFILRPVAVRYHQLAVGSFLVHQRAHKPIGGRLFHTLPRGFHRHLETVCVCVGNALEDILSVTVVTFQLSGGSFNDRNVIVSEFFHFSPPFYPFLLLYDKLKLLKSIISFFEKRVKKNVEFSNKFVYSDNSSVRSAALQKSEGKDTYIRRKGNDLF